MKTIANLLLGLCVVLTSAGMSFADDQVMFNYQGRVKVQGLAFDGTGYFKFAIVNSAGDVTLWSNDETSTGGSEPTASISVTVTDGIFNVLVGDPDLGMNSINRSVFNHPSKIKLRIWFSNGTLGFQRLLPDRKIVNPELMGLRSGTDDFTIYVNGATGNDDNSGLKLSKSKKTIQAAVDTLPERLRCNVTIDIADGVYREEVKVFGISLEPGKNLTLLGDESWTPSSPGDPAVRITGKDSDTTTTIVRDKAIWAKDCSEVYIKGLLLDYTTGCGVLFHQGVYRAYNCKSTNNNTGFGVSTNANANLYDCVSMYNSQTGIYVSSNTSVWLHRCKSNYNGTIGVVANTMCGLTFHGTGEFSNNGDSGIIWFHNSRGVFGDGYSGQINNNGLISGDGYGIEIRYDSYVEDIYKNSFSGNKMGDYWENTSTGGHIYI